MAVTESKKYAIIRASGSQYRISEGQEIDLFRLSGRAPGDSVEFGDVLLVNDNGKVTVGTPTVPQALVKGTVVSNLKGEKVRVATYKAKSRLRRVKGHRDQLTRVKIERIVLGNE